MTTAQAPQEPVFNVSLPKSTAEVAINAMAKLPWCDVQSHMQIFMSQLGAAAAQQAVPAGSTGEAAQ